MAARYWVGGSGTWDSSTTTNWSTTSGGTGGASVPTATDDVYINSSSGAGTISLSGTPRCSTLYASGTQTIDFGSSTFSVYGDFNMSASHTVVAGTSTIQLLNGNVYFNGAGKTYNIVHFSNATLFFAQVSGVNTFSTLRFSVKNTTNLSDVTFADNQTIGTFTVSSLIAYLARYLFHSNTLGTAVTLTVGAISGSAYADFRDITIAGAASPISGNFGDCLGNSGITFPAPKTVYYVGTSGDAFDGEWATTSTGVGSPANFPLAQDTIVITDNYPAASNTLDFGSSESNFGTFDFSGRTLSLTVYGSVSVYGDFTCGSGANTAFIGFTTYGRSTQTITSAGKTLYGVFVRCFGGTVTFADAFYATYIYMYNGSLSTTSANVTTTYFDVYGNNAKTIAFGSGTWSIGSSFTVEYPATMTVSGTGTISMTSASAKTFNGCNLQTWPTLNQGGAGALTVNGSNKFKGLTNTYGSTGATTIKFDPGNTNEFDDISLYGSAGKLCTLTSSGSLQTTLKKGSAWRIGPNSVNGGNNTGLLFMAGNGDYLNVSYINAQPFAGGDMMLIFGF